MLKTEQILNAKFTPVSKGTYNAEEVDAFLKAVAQSYETLNGEKAELLKKISILADKIESYRNDEEAIKLALLDAHRMAETISKNAQIKSDTLIGDAETRSQLIVDGANRQSAKLIEEARGQAKELVDNARTAVNSLTERAQAETDATLAAAKEKAAQIVADATAEGEKIVGNSKKLYEYYSAETAKLQASAESFKAAMAAICNDQLGLLDSVPAIESALEIITADEPEVAEEVIEEAAVEEVIEPEVTEKEEKIVSELPFGQSLMAEIENEIAAIEDSVAPAAELNEEFEAPADELEEETEVSADEIEEEAEQVVYVPEEPETAEETVSEQPAEESEIDDLFSLIDDMNFEDISSPDSVAANIDDILPVQAPVVINDVEDQDESDDEDFIVENDVDDVDEDDVFEGFKIDLDSIGGDDNGSDDDDLTSLFDSLFDD